MTDTTISARMTPHLGMSTPDMYGQDRDASTPLHMPGPSPSYRAESPVKERRDPWEEPRKEVKPPDKPKTAKQRWAERKEHQRARKRELQKFLMPRGRHLTKDEYESLVMDVMQPKTRSTSRYESCLLPDRAKEVVEQSAYYKVRSRLEDDKQNFTETYCDGEPPPLSPGQTSQHVHSKFTIQLPDENSQVHMRFSSTETPSGKPPRNTVKFGLGTLRAWFKAIDKDKSGKITRREMLLALRQNKALQSIFTDFEDPDDTNPPFTGLDAEPEEAKIVGKSQELKKIMNIVHQVDTGGSGTLEWEEVVDFFRKNGHLLEYETDKTLNQTQFRKDSFFHTVADVIVTGAEPGSPKSSEKSGGKRELSKGQTLKRLSQTAKDAELQGFSHGEAVSQFGQR